MGAVLVTGGAGYIGSHVVRQLGETAEKVIVLDNLGRGFRQAVTAGELVVGDVGDYALVSRLLAEHRVDTVMHFAAHTIVPESVAQPLKYYGNNTCSTRALLQACVEHKVRNFVFSSTAAVYGMPDQGYADEESPTRPINAYGTSKLMSEWMLRDVAAVNPLRYVALRYFNVAGSNPEGRIGQATRRGDFADQGGLRGDGGQASARGRVRQRLSHAGRHRGARLSARRRSGRGAFERSRIICAVAASR